MSFTPIYNDGPNPQPLLLVAFDFGGGTTLQVCSQNLDPANGGLTYSSTYLPRVTNETFDAVQIMSQQGIDGLPSLTIELADADMAMFAYERSNGFFGATITVKFIQAGSGHFTDEILIFKGICEAANRSGENLSIRAVSRFNLARIELPVLPIQRNCPNAFPSDAASRADGLTNYDSIYHRCRYSPDQGSSGLGDYQTGTTPFTTCGKTTLECKARGMFGVDHQGHTNGSFAGVTWDPPLAWKGKQYTDGNSHQGINNANYDKYKERVPMTFGTTWVKGVSMNVVGDANSTRGEVAIGTDTRPDMADATYGIRLLLWGEEIVPKDTATSDLLFRYYSINNGDIHGVPNGGAIYDSNGDPYGSMQIIEPIVPVQLAQSNSIPTVKALVGPQIYPSTPGLSVTWPDNLAFNVFWILRKAGLLASDFDIPSIQAAVNICDELINYTNGSGQPATAPRYRIGLSVEQVRSVADIIQGVRASGKLLVVPNVDGKIVFRVKGTLAEQQATDTGLPAISSIDRFGVAATGYPAYHFDESNVIDGSLKFSQLALNECTNEISVAFQDEDNAFTQSTLTYRDPLAYQRAQQKVSGSFTIEGCLSVNQAQRAGATKFAELYYGNPRNDPGGTWTLDFETTFQAAGLNVGDIVTFSDQQYGISNQLFRIHKIQPHSDFETCSVSMCWHNDAWYTDSFGVESPTTRTNSGTASYSAVGLLTAAATVAWSAAVTQVAIGLLTAIAGRQVFGVAAQTATGLLSAVSTTTAATDPLTGSGVGSWYAQVPRGAQNGANTNFLLDYTLFSPYALLALNGVDQLPLIQGDPSSLTATMAVSGGEFSISGRALTVANAPKAGEKFFIRYFRKDPIAAVTSATVNVWSSFTAGDGVCHSYASVTYHDGGSGAIVYNDNFLFSLRHDTASLSSFPSTISGFSGYSITASLDGSLFATDENSLNLYDCYITLVLADASVYQIRPVSWAFTSGSDAPIASWAPTTGYGAGVKIIDSNGNIQMCTVAGTSGASQPAWATSGTTSDGGATWAYQGDGTTQTSSTGQIANPNRAFDTDTVPPATFATFKRTHYSGLSTGGTFTLFF